MELKKLLTYLFEQTGQAEPILELAIIEGMDETAQYPEGFNIKTLKTLPSFAQKLKYLRDFLPYLGAGSSRSVFRADQNLALKMAKNSKGLAQNKAEVSVSKDADRDGYNNLIARVIDHDPNFLWVESELARRAISADWKKAFGQTQQDMLYAIGNFDRPSYFSSIGSQRKNTEEASEFLDGVRSFVENTGTLAGDLARPSSWGVVSRDGKDRLVIIDYGFTEDIRKKFYTRK